MFSENQEAESDKFERVNYIPPRDRSKYLRYLYIACSIVVLTVVIIAVVCTKDDASKIKTSEMLNGKVFLIINDTKLMKFNHTTRNLDLVLETPESSVISAFVVHEDNVVHWTESKASRLVSQSTKGVKVLLGERRFTPGALALDRVSQNIYVVDKTAGTLIGMSVRNGYYAILLTDLVNAHDVMLDSEKGLIFILQQSHSILRAKMDGSEPVQVVTNNGITALTIDTSRKRLYWINDFINIESSNYDGEKRQSVFTDTVTITSITVLDNHLFWIWSSHQQSVSLLSCKIDLDDTCQEHSTYEINAAGNVKSIRGYFTPVPWISNPCQVNNGGCKQLCFPNGRNQSICGCRMGWELNPDRFSCHKVRDFVLYPYGDVVRTCSMDGKQEIFWPTPYKVKTLDVKSEIDFDYDLKNDDFYFSDDRHIHRMKIQSYAGQEVILNVDSSDIIIEDIAYDWFTGNMYYGQRHIIDASLEHSLMVFNPRLKKAYHKTLVVSDNDRYVKFRSYGIVVHPAKGQLFATYEDSMDSNIFAAEVNDTNFRDTYQIFADGVQKHRFFTIDHTTDRLYEIQKTNETTWVAHKSIETSDMKFTLDANFICARTISVHQKWLYLTNFSSIYRFDKEAVQDGVQIAPRVENPAKRIVGVRIISEEVQFTGLDNPCTRNNGGCEQFCFAGSIATCDCKDGQKVKSNGRCD